MVRAVRSRATGACARLDANTVRPGSSVDRHDRRCVRFSDPVGLSGADWFHMRKKPRKTNDVAWHVDFEIGTHESECS